MTNFKLTAIANHHWIETDDGSYTLHSNHFNEACHSTSGAISETSHYYLDGCKISSLFETPSSIILEVGLGLGHGLLQTIALHKKFSKHKLHYISLEIATELIAYVKDLLKHDWIVKNNIHEVYIDNCRITIIEGDARTCLPEYLKANNIEVDAIYQDAFSPKRNVDLWTTEWFKLLHTHSKSNCRMTTYSSSKAMRKSMLDAGWALFEGMKFGAKKSSTLAISHGESEVEILAQLERSPTPAISDNNKGHYISNFTEKNHVPKK